MTELTGELSDLFVLVYKLQVFRCSSQVDVIRLSLNLMPPAPLYLRTLWRYTNAVIIMLLLFLLLLRH